MSHDTKDARQTLTEAHILAAAATVFISGSLSFIFLPHTQHSIGNNHVMVSFRSSCIRASHDLSSKEPSTRDRCMKCYEMFGSLELSGSRHGQQTCVLTTALAFRENCSPVQLLHYSLLDSNSSENKSKLMDSCQIDL